MSEIYRAAARVICEKGYDATSMNDIAEAVGITKAGIYHHISTKGDLLFQIMNFGLDALEEEVVLPSRSIVDPEKRLRSIVSSHVQLIMSRSAPQGTNPVTIVSDEVAGLSPVQRRKIIKRKRDYVELIRETLRQLDAQGRLVSVDITVATFCLLGMILWLARWFNPDGRLPSEAISEQITIIALGGLLKPPAPANDGHQ